MNLKTLEWAHGLRTSLTAEINRLIDTGISTSHDLQRITQLRQQLKQAENLITSLEAYEKSETEWPKDC